MTVFPLIRKCSILLSFLSLFTFTVPAQENLYVFYPSTIRPQSIQNRMTELIGGIKIIVFDRYNDFITQTKADLPDAVLSKTSLIKDQCTNYTILLNGIRNGAAEEKYVLLSIGKPLTLESITSNTVIGVVDIFGRTGTKIFVKNSFSIEPKLQRVSKIEDLLPMLCFNMASGILIEDNFVGFFKSTSQLDFAITPLPLVNESAVALATKDQGNFDKIVSFLKSNNKEICDLFFIEQWK